MIWGTFCLFVFFRKRVGKKDTPLKSKKKKKTYSMSLPVLKFFDKGEWVCW